MEFNTYEVHREKSDSYQKGYDEGIRKFAGWCYINGIDFSYMRKHGEEPFIDKMIEKFRMEGSKN